MNAITSGSTIRSEGKIAKWDPRKGFGLIELPNGRKFFAHIRAFAPSRCVCGRIHACEVSQGTKVEFSVTLGTPYQGQFPAATEIVVVEAQG